MFHAGLKDKRVWYVNDINSESDVGEMRLGQIHLLVKYCFLFMKQRNFLFKGEKSFILVKSINLYNKLENKLRYVIKYFIFCDHFYK